MSTLGRCQDGDTTSAFETKVVVSLETGAKKLPSYMVVFNRKLLFRFRVVHMCAPYSTKNVR